jgi:hypothetical protein
MTIYELGPCGLGWVLPKPEGMMVVRVGLQALCVTPTEARQIRDNFTILLRRLNTPQSGSVK